MGRHFLQILALSVGFTLLAAWPAYAWGGTAGLAALGTAAGICLFGALVGAAVGQLFRRLDPGEDAGPKAVQAAIGMRMMVTLAASLPVLLVKPFPQVQFVVWLAANYLLHLFLEVFVSLRDLGQNARPSRGGAEPPAADLSEGPMREAPPAASAPTDISQE